jgi:hypothetical protein
MYKVINSPEGVTLNLVQRLSDNAFIPFDPANTDYQEYLKWVAEGNEPLPADEPVQPEG